MSDQMNQEEPTTIPSGIPLLDDQATEDPTAPVNEVFIITGISGAGRTGTACALEDLDWYVVDNLPPAMIPALVGMVNPDGADVCRLAVVVDARSRSYFSDLAKALGQLKGTGALYQVIFLGASAEALVKRYENNWRPHPMQAGGILLGGIAAEKNLLVPVRRITDGIIDTSRMNVRDLTRHIRDVVVGEGTRALRVTVESFGFKRGIPIDADHVLDVRFLKNPYWVDELRHLTGRDHAVTEYVLAQPGVREFVESYAQLLASMLQGCLQELKPFTTIAVGRTSGKHRSVACVELIAATLRGYGYSARVHHRDLGRE